MSSNTKVFFSSSSRQRAVTTSQADLLALNKRPAQPQLTEENLLTRFIEFFSRAARRSSWTLKLPDLKQNPDAHALRSSLRAVSLAYFAHVTQDPAVQFESLRHYGQSLARQRSALTRLPNLYRQSTELASTVEVDVDAATNALLATVILSYFELISPSGLAQRDPSPGPWIHHTLAAERLIAILGPQSLSNDIIGQLFFSIRSHAVHRAAVLGYYTVFSEREWLEAAARHVSKQSYARTVYDRITEVILRLSRLKLAEDGGNDIRYSRLTRDEAAEDDEDTAESLLKEISRRYEAFLRCCRKIPVEEVPLFLNKSSTSSQSLQVPSLLPGQRLVGSTDPSLSSNDILLQDDPVRTNCMTTGMLAEGLADLSDLHPKLQKVFAAMTTAYFHAAVILLQSYFPEVTHRPSTSLRAGEWVTPESIAIDAAEDGSLPGSPQEPGDRGTVLDDIGMSRDGGWNTLYNARIILAAGKHLAPPGKSNGTAVLRMMLPFSVIWHFCHHDRGFTGKQALNERKKSEEGGWVAESKAVRQEARDLFSEWCRREGMGGLVAIGFGQSI